MAFSSFRPNNSSHSKNGVKHKEHKTKEIGHFRPNFQNYIDLHLKNITVFHFISIYVCVVGRFRVSGPTGQPTHAKVNSHSTVDKFGDCSDQTKARLGQHDGFGCRAKQDTG